jgi:ADP-ribose pyrophosphatase YjhB (NUDIX family)
MSALHSVSVAGAIVDDMGRVLVIQRRDNGRWEVPGGVLELGEFIIDGLKREVLEETGLAIEPIRLTGVNKNETRAVVALVFRARIIGGTPTTTEEAARIEWWTEDMIVGRMAEAFAIRALDALRQDGPAVRTHDGERLLDDCP